MTGSGKSEVVNYLVKLSWQKVYFGTITFEELERRKLKVNEKNERMIREWLRKKYGMAAYAILNLPKIRKALQLGSVVVESLYSWEEYKMIKKKYGHQFKVLAVYAPFYWRTKRMKNRVKRPLGPKELLSRDYAQIENINIAGPIADADFTVINDGSKKKIYQQVDKILQELKNLRT